MDTVRNIYNTTWKDEGKNFILELCLQMDRFKIDL